jgi:hypothetical protein
MSTPLIKFMAFFLSGSGAMLSEAIHSAADTGNQVLLFLGLKRASRERDEEFHYGYGGERFIFGILSAAGIFFVGCGVTVYHGITSLLHPHQPEIGPVTFVVLGVSFLIEGGVLFKAEIRLNASFVAERVQGLLPPGLAVPSGESRARLLEEVARNAIQAVSDEIDAIELAVQAVIPEARHIDLEIDHTPGS